MEVYVDYLWFFIFYSMIGWAVEVSFQTIKKRTFVNRGFLNGPYCPIYGIGMSFLIFIFSPFNNLIVLFFGSIIITTILEYITGYILETIFNKKWWDYSKEPFNLNGYISLFFSIRWGVAAVLVVFFIHPIVLFTINYLHNYFGYVFLILLMTTIFMDFIVTIAEILNIKQTYFDYDNIVDKFEEQSDQIGLNIFEKVFAALIFKDKLRIRLLNFTDKISLFLESNEFLRDKKCYIKKRLAKSYPGLINFDDEENE